MVYLYENVMQSYMNSMKETQRRRGMLAANSRSRYPKSNYMHVRKQVAYH
jgi:hypothetical protein